MAQGKSAGGKRGQNKNIYMDRGLVVELDAHADGHARSAASIVDEALRQWMEKNPIDPARRRLIDERRALTLELKTTKRVEEMGIEPGRGARRALALATRRRAA